MPVNPFFNQTSYTPEQDLLQDLWDEAIQIHGHNVFYVMRDDVSVDHFFGEDPLAKFTHAFPIEMFIKSYSQFGGQGDFISKFGLHIEDQCTFSCSVRRFDEVCGKHIVRPREGDWLFIQMSPNSTHSGMSSTSDRPHRFVFEIRKVDDKEDGLFQLGEHYTWQMTTEQVNYSHEKVSTNTAALNETTEVYAYTVEIALGTGDGTYLVGETVYQGLSFPSAIATGDVVHFDANTSVLKVQNITGEFNNTLPVVGITSGATYTCPETPSTAPTVHDPISDNETLDDIKGGVVINRGSNPRLS